VRVGDDRAFEALYARYHRRIAAYVLGMVKDHGRAEEVTQDVFVSALRRMRADDRPIRFRPWIYEIAKNACIDAFRRSHGAHEVSWDAETGLAPADERRLVGGGATPETELAAKQELEHLRGAFSELSDTQHQVLVMRELGGLSYREIGERLDLTRPAVESTLFRARRRIAQEYGELASGARCTRIEGLVVQVSGDVGLGPRDERRVGRHIASCAGCRRLAAQAGLDVVALTRRPVRARIAALLPLPGLLRDRWMPPGPGATQLALAATQVGDPSAGAGWGRAAVAAVAVLAAGLGTGASDHQRAAPSDRAAPRADGATVAQLAAGSQATVAVPGRPGVGAPAAQRTTRRGAGGATTGSVRVTVTAPVAGRPGEPSSAGAGHAATPAATGRRPGAPSKLGSGSVPPATASSSPSTTATTPVAPVSAGSPPSDAVATTASAVNGAAGVVDGTMNGVGQTVTQVVDDVAGAIAPVAPAVAETVDHTAGEAVHQATQVVDQTVQGAAGLANGLLPPGGLSPSH
jgi:RNA polymerase sigma factor (sigma-70 family)